MVDKNVAFTIKQRHYSFYTNLAFGPFNQLGEIVAVKIKSHRPSLLSLLLSQLFVLGIILSSVAHAIDLRQNLIINGDAESGQAALDIESFFPVPNWNTTSNFTAVSYSASGGGPNADTPGPSNRGASFFAGGPQNEFATAEQRLDLSSIATAIDPGRLTFTLEGYLGAFATNLDQAKFSAIFLGGSNQELARTTIGPVTIDDRDSETALLFRSKSGPIPSGTRSVRFLMEMTRLGSGRYNDGYADNLSFAIFPDAVVPVPALPEYGLTFLFLLLLLTGFYLREKIR